VRSIATIKMNVKCVKKNENMSTRVEKYIIYGLKFGEDFTKEYWKKDFYDAMEWNKNKPSDKPFFLTDGMNGSYTFFGFITELHNGWDEIEEKEINLSCTKAELVHRFYELYPDSILVDEDIKLYFLPHWV
jgi:hypothetical protein